MWRHYLSMGVRSMLADRLFTLVNLVGLSAGLAAVSLIALYVSGQLSHDRWVPGHERIYRIDTTETTPDRDSVDIALAPGPLKDALLKDFPEIEEIARAYPLSGTIVRDGTVFREDLLVADPGFFSVLRMPFRAGSSEAALSGTGSVAISARAAEKYFGRANPIGMRLTLRTPEPRDFVVGAVFETLPANSHMRFDIVLPFAGYFDANRDEVRAIPDAWGGSYFFTYASLAQNADPRAIEERLPAFVDRNVPAWMKAALKSAPHDYYRFRFVNLPDVHFDGGPVGAMKPGGSRGALAGLGVTALLILGVAAVNFANLATARSTLRSREVAVRKVVGASRRQIFAQFLAEAILMIAVAGLIGLSLVELTLPYLSAALGVEPELMAALDFRFWGGLLFLILSVALLTGFYPALVVSRIRPALALNGHFVRAAGGRIRQWLVVGQFAVSIGLIIVTIVMAMQVRFTRAADLGFDRNNLLVMRLSDGEEGPAAARLFADAVARLPGVVGTALSSSVPADESEDNMSFLVPGALKPVQIGYHRIDPKFFDTYRVTALAGRTFVDRGPETAEDPSRPVPAVINASAVPRLGLDDPSRAVGRLVRTADRSYEIVGVVPDVHFRSLHERMRDEIYLLNHAPGTALTVRLRDGSWADAAGPVASLWRARFPGQPFEPRFLDDKIDDLYAEESRQALLASIFSAVAILLSCLGLAAMTAFTLQRRTKEMAIRKVLGATTPDILRLLMWQFSRPVLLANLLAWPAAWLLLRGWLNGFAYRIDIPPLAFAAAGIVTLGIALAAVSVHALAMARVAPAGALRRD